MKYFLVVGLLLTGGVIFVAQSFIPKTYSLREMTESERRSYHSQQRPMFGSGPYVWDGKKVWLSKFIDPDLIERCKDRYKVTGIMGPMESEGPPPEPGVRTAYADGSEWMLGQVSKVECDEN
jgi:hypothetical protein